MIIKGIKWIIKLWKEEEEKKEAYRKLVKQMTNEEYRIYKGTCDKLSQRKAFVDYAERNSICPLEKGEAISVIDTGKIGRTHRKKSHGIEYTDSSIYKVIRYPLPSPNEVKHQFHTSTDMKKIIALKAKYK